MTGAWRNDPDKFEDLMLRYFKIQRKKNLAPYDWTFEEQDLVEEIIKFFLEE